MNDKPEKKNEIKEKFAGVAGDVKQVLMSSLSKSQNIVSLSKIKPTQITVGLSQVMAKQKRLRQLSVHPEKLAAFLIKRPIPLVLGPQGKHYAIDHHHLGCALVREKFKVAAMVYVADYSSLSQNDFWKKMQEMQYVHPRDENGRKKSFKAIPDKLSELKDDPYRSLAGLARRSGAFEKAQVPFAEFEWADYFRKSIPPKTVKRDFGKALKRAKNIANHEAAKGLPGYKIANGSLNKL